ncbi:MAG: alpha/beta fold hydrolase [Gammaproteobacteria bacterium]|nr:alpha/beta fold hydrolase [Gammaproteobacteria bacterium]
MQRLRGSTALLFDTVEQITNLVERTHTATAAKVFRPLAAIEPTATVSTPVKAVHDTTAGGVYQAIRGVNNSARKLAGFCLEMGFDIGSALRQRNLSSAQSGPAVPLETQDPTAATANDSSLLDHNLLDHNLMGHKLIDQVESALNAFYGDFLHQRQNPLDIGMSFRLSGKRLPMARELLTQKIHHPSGKVVIFIHGLACTESIWSISAEEFHGDPCINFGSLLSDDLGYTSLYIRYNSGRHISENGKLLSALLTQLIAEYPGNIEELLLIGHSMGGLVARSAAHYGSSNNEPWTQRLRQIFCVGTPNLGAPLEKGTNVLSSLLGSFNSAGTRVPAEILNARSAGIKDLRFGYTTEEDWAGKDPDGFLEDNRHNLPLLEGVAYYSIAATVTRDPKHPLGVLLGDLLVRQRSAAGQAREPAQQIAFHSGNVLPGMTHLYMANHPAVYRVIRQKLTPATGCALATSSQVI